MPELPEVETVARGLRKSIVGRRIVSVSIGKTDFIDNPQDIERYLPGRVVEAVDRFGKFLLLRLSPSLALELDGEDKVNPAALLVHLGMTGRLRAEPVAEPHRKHTHVVFLLDDARELRYNDSRRFGRMAYFAGASLNRELQRFGADPLEVSQEEFAVRIGTRHARIKALLLDQSVLRGVGNIYADESLWRAKIHPARLGLRLKKLEIQTLHRVLRDVLQKAILLRGSSIINFLDGDGREGDYQREHQAYGREGEKCRRCGARIRRIIVAGRSSFFCPQCQRGRWKKQSKPRKIYGSKKHAIASTGRKK